MPNCPRPAVLLLLLLCLPLTLSTATEERLLHLASPEATALFWLNTDPGRLPRFRTGLDSPEIEEAATTLREVLAILSPGDSTVPSALLELLGPSPASALAEALCPALERPLIALAGGSGRLPPFEALLSLEVGTEQPTVTALIDFPSGTPATSRMLELALAGCAGNVVETAGAVPAKMYLFGDEWSPLVVLPVGDGIFAISTEPAAVAAVLQRAQGLGNGPLSPVPLQRLEGELPFMRLLLRPPTLVAPLLTGTVAEAAASRLAQALRTIELIVLQWSADDDGLLAESVIALHPEGPDSRLRELLSCDDCKVPHPDLIPATSYLTAAGRWPVQETFEYLAWLLGEDGEKLQERIGEATGIDLEEDLFSWLGQEFQLAQLSPYTTELSSLLYGPGTVLMVEVTDPPVATAALQRLTLRLSEVFADTAAGIDLPLAVRDSSYRGVTMRRLQLSANLDLGYAVVGDSLLLALPAAALRPVVDTFRGAPSISTSVEFMRSRAGAPDDALSIVYRDDAAQFRATSDALAALAQPLAFLLHRALAAKLEDGDGSSGAGWTVELDMAEATPVGLGTLSGELGAGPGSGARPRNQQVDGKSSHLYALAGLEPGQRMRVVLESQSFDTMLYLIEAESGTVVALNDDAPDTSRSELAFTAQEGAEYLLQVTSFGGDEGGEYRLSLEAVADVADPIEPPSFERLLDLAELPSRIAALLATQLSSTFGYSSARGDLLYSRSLTSPAR